MATCDRDCQGVALRFNLWQFNDESEGGGCTILGAGVSKIEADAIREECGRNFVDESRLLLVQL
jgi:hypothetical protein